MKTKKVDHNAPKMHIFTCSSSASGQIDKALAKILSVSRKQAKHLLDQKRVFVNGKRVWMAKHSVSTGDKIEIVQVEEQGGLSESSVLFEDESYVVVNKPAGIVTNGADSLEDDIRVYLNHPSMYAVHRLDKDTTGCVVFARSKALKEGSEVLFREKEITKEYCALVAGSFPVDIEVIDSAIDGKKAVTAIELLAVGSLASYLRVSIETGRMHQIRKHLNYVGHPVIGDREYGGSKDSHHLLRAAPRQMLHAASLSFTSPFSNELIEVEAPLPSDFIECARSLGLDIDGPDLDRPDPDGVAQDEE